MAAKQMKQIEALKPDGDGVQEEAIRRLRGRIGWVLGMRTVVRWTLLAFLTYGTLLLVLRLVFQVSASSMMWGVLLLLPLGAAAFVRGWLERPPMAELSALMDSHNHYGGLLMAGREVSIQDWRSGLSPVKRLPVEWKNRQILTQYPLAVLYLVMTLWLPDQLIAPGKSQPLEIGQLVKEISSQIEALEQEKIVEQSKATEIQEKLNRLKEEAQGGDPAKTWEALDHLRQSASESAQKAAEESLAKLESLAQAETLAAALALTSPSNLNNQVSIQAMQEMGQLLQNASLEEQAMDGGIPPELLAALKTNGLSADQLGQLMQSIQSLKGQLGQVLTNLADLKMIDGKMLGKCAGAGRIGDTNALAAFLSSCDSTNGLNNLLISYGRGGRDRGRGDAPMTWSEGTDEEDAQFKEQVLPRSGGSGQDAQLVGISRATPQLTDAREAIESGALSQAVRGGGAAHAQRILPRHRESVRTFFERQE